MRSILGRISLAVGLLVMVGCNSAARVYVNYKQIANFRDYRLAPGASSHGAGDGMFIMYKVTSITNNGSQPATFTFDRFKVSTVAPDQTSNDTVTDASILLSGMNLTTLTVPAGQSVPVDRCFIKNALTSNPQSLVMTKVPILYAGTGDQPVSTNDVAESTSPIAVGNALPESLQDLCLSN